MTCEVVAYVYCAPGELSGVAMDAIREEVKNIGRHEFDSVVVGPGDAIEPGWENGLVYGPPRGRDVLLTDAIKEAGQS